MQWLHEACMQLTEEWTPPPCMKIGASFLHVSPPPFLYKQPVSPPLHTLGYHTGRLLLHSPSDSTLSACLLCVEALEVFTLSPLLSSSLRGSPAKICIHNFNKGGYCAKALVDFGFYKPTIFFKVAVAWRLRLQHSFFLVYDAEALPKIFSLYPYFTILALHSHSKYAILILHYIH